MKIGIAADHGAYYLKETILAKLGDEGMKVVDFGATAYDANDDYPDFVIPLAQAVASGEVSRGIALCGSGVGACFTANKVANIRAALINDTYSAHQGVEHDDMNILCVGARVTGEMLAMEIIDAFLKAKFTGEARHVRRLNKAKKLER